MSWSRTLAFKVKPKLFLLYCDPSFPPHSSSPWYRCFCWDNYNLFVKFIFTLNNSCTPLRADINSKLEVKPYSSGGIVMTVCQRNLEHKKAEIWMFFCRCLEDCSKLDGCVSPPSAFLYFFYVCYQKCPVLIIIINLWEGNKKE